MEQIMPEYNENYEYMIGTGGGRDYLVVAKVEELSFGIKPVIELANGMQLFIGFRVRLHANTPAVVAKIPSIAAYLDENPHLFAFEKINKKRASAMTGARYPIPFGLTAESLLEKLEEQGFIGAMVDHLSGFFAIETPMEAIREFVIPRLTKQLVLVEQRYGKMVAPEGYDEALAKLVASQGETE